MQVNKLTLTNFRGLTNSILDFTPGFNLIVGVNGAGKTAVLDALKILLAHALPHLADTKNFPGIGLERDDITLGRNQTFLQLDLSRQDKNYSLALSEQRETIRDAIDADKGLKDIRDPDKSPRLRHGERPARGDPRLEGTLRGQTSNRPELFGILEPKSEPSLRKQKPQPLVLYLSVRRAIANRRTSRGRGNPAYHGIFDIERGLELGKIEDWWKSREVLARENPQSRSATQLATVIGALERLLPQLSGWRIENDALTVSKTADVEQMNDQGEPVIVQEHHRLAVGLLSDGERSLIAIGADIAQRLALLNDESDSPLDNGEGVVLIDELDLHLHPHWQRAVVESLRRAFPKLQFICTTHSLFLIQAQRTGNLILLDRIGDEEEAAEQYHHKSIEDIAEEVQGVEIPQRSQRYLEMMRAAKRYYEKLHELADDSTPEVNNLRQQLDELSIPFGDDPGFVALLKFERDTLAARKAKKG